MMYHVYMGIRLHQRYPMWRSPEGFGVSRCISYGYEVLMDLSKTSNLVISLGWVLSYVYYIPLTLLTRARTMVSRGLQGVK